MLTLRSDERKIEADAKDLRDSRFNVDPGKTYSLAELVNGTLISCAGVLGLR
jgi:hypothetical protein